MASSTASDTCDTDSDSGCSCCCCVRKRLPPTPQSPKVYAFTQPLTWFFDELLFSGYEPLYRYLDVFAEMVDRFEHYDHTDDDPLLRLTAEELVFKMSSMYNAITDEYIFVRDVVKRRSREHRFQRPITRLFPFAILFFKKTTMHPHETLSMKERTQTMARMIQYYEDRLKWDPDVDMSNPLTDEVMKFIHDKVTLAVDEKPPLRIPFPFDRDKFAAAWKEVTSKVAKDPRADSMMKMIASQLADDPSRIQICTCGDMDNCTCGPPMEGRTRFAMCFDENGNVYDPQVFRK